MRSVYIVLGGLLLFGMVLLVARLTGSSAPTALAAKCFGPIWLLVATANMWVGVTQAGYTVTEETPVFLLVFLIPTALAALCWWKWPGNG